MSVKISALPAAASVASTDQFETNQSVVSRRATSSQISDFVKSVPTVFTGIAGPAFGVQQNNASARNLLVVIVVNIIGDGVTPGASSVHVITNQTSPALFCEFAFAHTDANDHIVTMTIVVPVGGWYRIDDFNDPNNNNNIVSVSEYQL